MCAIRPGRLAIFSPTLNFLLTNHQFGLGTFNGALKVFQNFWFYCTITAVCHNSNQLLWHYDIVKLFYIYIQYSMYFSRLWFQRHRCYWSWIFYVQDINICLEQLKIMSKYLCAIPLLLMYHQHKWKPLPLDDTSIFFFFFTCANKH